jgi:hypothetical protein
VVRRDEAAGDAQEYTNTKWPPMEFVYPHMSLKGETGAGHAARFEGETPKDWE